jgi:hypothetical protein
MKRFFTLIFLAMFMATPALANEEEDSIALTESMLEIERRAIVERNLPLNHEQWVAFWPVYDEFQAALRELNRKRANLIRNLASEFETLEGPRAQDMLRESLKIDSDRLKVKTKFIRKFNGVIPQKTVVRYFQIEGKLDAIVAYEMAGAIPLVRPEPAPPKK